MTPLKQRDFTITLHYYIWTLLKSFEKAASNIIYGYADFYKHCHCSKSRVRSFAILENSHIPDKGDVIPILWSGTGKQ